MWSAAVLAPALPGRRVPARPNVRDRAALPAWLARGWQSQATPPPVPLRRGSGAVAGSMGR